MEIKKPYLHTDTDWETIYKNKTNIFDLYAQIILLSDLTGKSFEELGKLVGDYDQDINGNLDASKSVIENLSIVAENLTSVENRVNANEQRLTSVESRVTIIENDGIGNYIGTYRTRDNDDSSTLPNPAQDKDRAITEYLSGNDYKYQEWEYKVDTWTKIGVELDSHIHSQSNGITLADVLNATIAYRKGQVISFNEKQTGKFLDATLFTEKAITFTSGGNIKISGEIKGSTIYSTLVFKGSNDQVVQDGSLTFRGGALVDSGNLRVGVISTDDGDKLIHGLNADLSKTTNGIISDTKYQYTALKDITNADMEK